MVRPCDKCLSNRWRIISLRNGKDRLECMLCGRETERLRDSIDKMILSKCPTCSWKIQVEIMKGTPTKSIQALIKGVMLAKAEHRCKNSK